MEIKVFLMGPPAVSFNDQQLVIPRRQVRILLYLLAGQKQPIPLDRLNYLFWIEQPEAVCRRNLSHLFTHLRNSVPNKEILVLDRVSAGLRPDLIWSDLLEFKYLSGKLGIQENLPFFLRAHQLYRGPYLEGKNIPQNNELEKLIEQNRANLEGLYLKNLTKLISLNKDIKKYSVAIEYAEEYLRLDVHNEKILGELLLLHYKLGNQSKVIQQYSLFSEQLRDELDIQPSLRTQDLFQKIKSSFSDKGYPAPALTISTDQRPEFQYNHNHLMAFQKIIEKNEGSSGIVLICGDLGAGKSNLLTNYFNQNGGGRISFRIKCMPATKKIRYYPFKDLASQVVSCNQQKKHNSKLFSERVVLIAHQLSEPMQINASVSDDVLNLIRERDFSLIQNLFNEMGNVSERVLICIEDLEWADDDSIDLIAFLSNKLVNKNVIFVCSFCCTKEKALKVFENHIQNSKAHLGTVHLDDLSFSETRELVKKAYGEFSKIDQVTTQMVNLTSGNSFYVFEILKSMKTLGLSVEEISELKAIGIPASVTQEITARMERLNNEEQDILHYAAIKRTAFGFDEIRKLFSMKTKQVVSTLDDLVDRHLLVVESTEYSIKHEIVRQAILLNMSPVRKQVLQSYVREPASDQK